MKYKRIFIIVMDSLGVGFDSSSHLYDDEGANTLLHIYQKNNGIDMPTLYSLGIGDFLKEVETPIIHKNSYTMYLKEASNGKDTLTGHHEMMGIKTSHPFKTFTDTGFPKELIDQLEKETGHKLIGNKAASGTEIIKELGDEQRKTNSLIIYTSSDSVLQLAAHEETTGLQELYRCCEIARRICLKEEYKVGRIIARPFLGDKAENYYRTPNRHDYALKPEKETVMNVLKDKGFDVMCVGKISDIFANEGVTESIKTVSNSDGMEKTINLVNKDDITGIVFVNLVEFDSSYGHRRDVTGYAKAIEQFDKELKVLISNLKDDDLLMITADHGNDPTWHGTDHTREKVPLIIYNKNFNKGTQLNEKNTFADIGASVLYNFNLDKPDGLIGEVIKEIY